MDKKHIDSLIGTLKNKICPICGGRILPFHSTNELNNIPDNIPLDKRSFYEKIDLSEDYFDIECGHCGYVMNFKKETFFK
ncbi:hypothetical protein NXY00_00815 [Bacteroides sp. BFG-551]|nr:hypothetical protein [Bacteroides sp. BFG-551]